MCMMRGVSPAGRVRCGRLRPTRSNAPRAIGFLFASGWEGGISGGKMIGSPGLTKALVVLRGPSSALLSYTEARDDLRESEYGFMPMRREAASTQRVDESYASLIL